MAYRDANGAPIAGTPFGDDAAAGATAAAGALAPALPAQAGKTNVLTGILVTGSGATGTSIIVITVTGLVGGTMSIEYVVPAGATLVGPTVFLDFGRGIPASGPNVAITLNVPSMGAGNTNAAAHIRGFAI